MCDKKSYSYTAAHRAIHVAHEPNYEGKKRKKSIPNRAYKCKICGQWHLTNKPFLPKHHDE